MRQARITSQIRVVRCDCPTRHADYASLARCVWGRVRRIDGNGAYGLVRCHEHAISMYSSLEIARMALAYVDETSCSREQCVHQHQLVALSLAKD